jgi:TolB-like protein/DNA-binding winged helix-turn-helix (wHTH) protein/Flp pilus assembly protein TadD
VEKAVQSTRVVRFANFEVDLDSGELRKNSLKLKFSGQPFEVLAILLEKPGAIVTREQLQQRLWPDSFVDFDHNLNSAINRIREALGDSAVHPQFVETLPRRGYRFIAPVEEIGRGKIAVEERGLHSQSRRWVLAASALAVALVVAASLWWTHRTSVPARHISSLAVLPLVNLSGDPQQEYFADGVTDELITHLSRISALKVTSRTSVMRYKGTKKSLPEIARELGVEGVLEGTIARSGNQVRISAQLIDASSDTHLWSDSYERDLEDILALQSEVALAITRHVSVAITPEQKKQLESAPVVNVEAYEYYLKGNHYFWRRDVERAVESFDHALKADPNYAKAWAGLAESYVIFEAQDTLLPRRESINRAKAAAARALQIDNTVAAAHVALGWAKLVDDWDWLGAEEEFKLAKELDPHSEIAPFWYACELTWIGNFQAALDEMRQARGLAPASPIIYAFSGMAFYQARQNQQAIQVLTEALQLDNTNSAAHQWLGLTYLTMGMQKEAIAELETARQLGEAQNIRVSAPVSRLGYVYGVTGRTRDAMAMLDELNEMSKTKYVSPVHFRSHLYRSWPKKSGLLLAGKGLQGKEFRDSVDKSRSALRLSPFRSALSRSSTTHKLSQVVAVCAR